MASAASGVFALDDREAHLAAGDALQVVPRDAELALDGADLLAELLSKILDERLHDVVVEQLAELGLVPTLVELFGLGDRNVALGGFRAAACRWRGRPKPARPLAREAKSPKTATNGECSLQGGISWTREGNGG